MSLDETKDPNKVFRWRLGGERPFRILLQGNVTKMQAQVSAPTDPPGKPNKNVIRGRRPEDILIRRKGSLINFYDLGQLKGADFEVIGWSDHIQGVGPQIDPNISGSHPGGGGSTHNPILPPFELSHWDEVHNIIFAVPFSQWKDKYRKITPVDADDPDLLAEHYGIAYFKEGDSDTNPRWIRPDNPEWSEKGLQNTSKIKVRSNMLVMDFDLRDEVNYKVTSEFNYAADPVDINLSNGADIFMMPELQYHMFQDILDTDVPVPGINQTDYYYYCGYGSHLRQTLLKRTGWGPPRYDTDVGVDPDPAERIFFEQYTPTGLNRYVSFDPENTWVGLDESFINDTFFQEYISLLGYHYNYFPNSNLITIRDINFASTGHAVDEITEEIEGHIGAFTANLWTRPANFTNGAVHYDEGTLAAVILIKGTPYYVWNATDNPGDDDYEMKRFAWYNDDYL